MSTAPASTLHVISTAHRRGAQVFAAQLDAWMIAAGHRTATVALGEGGDAPVDAEVLGDRLGFRQLRRLRAARSGFDVALAHGSRGLTGCALSGASTPFVYRNIGDPAHWQSGGSRARRAGFYIRRASRVLALWDGAAEHFATEFGVPRERIDVVPNAVQGGAFLPADDAARSAARAALGLHPDKRIVAYLGALSAEKRVVDAVGAAAHIDNAQLVLAGEGPELAIAHRSAVESGVDLVHVGVLATPATLLHAADTVILPSQTEGMPAVLIEAGLCGVPVVATDVGAVSSVVRNGETGVLASVGDVVALGAALDVALRSRRSMGAAAAEHCQQFTFEHVGPQVQDALHASI